MVKDSFEYITREGDTFDILALDAYNDELMAGVIARANPAVSDVLVFGAGVALTIPIVEQTETGTLPPWKRR